MILTIMRHGETEYNSKRLIQGAEVNSVLTENGKNQVQESAMEIKKNGIKYDIIASSLLSRAIESAVISNSIIGISNIINIEAHFAERDYGNYNKMGLDEFYDIRNKGDLDDTYENDQDFMSRVYFALVKLVSSYQDKNILLVSHSQVLKAVLILAKAQGITFSSFIKNAGYYTFEINETGITLLA